MRLFYAALALEANTFLAQPTSYEAFVEKLYYPPGQYPPQQPHQTGAMDAVRALVMRGAIELIEGSCYAAQPGGAASRDAYERMRDEILGQLQAALPVDGVVLNLHGAMVAHGYDDCEGDILERVRTLVGDRCVIGVELDPHCHLTVKRCALADIIVLFKEYPHTDFAERGVEMVELVRRTIRRRDHAGEVRVRLPHDRELSDLDPADARAGGSDHGAGRQGARALDLDRPLLPVRRRAGMRHARPRDHR